MAYGNRGHFNMLMHLLHLSDTLISMVPICMSIYRRLIVIGKYLDGKFIAGKLVRFIGSKNKWENATIIPI